MGVEPSVHCGGNIPDLPPSCSNVVVLEFRSDSSVNFQGFRLTYAAINPTDTTISPITGEAYELTSHLYT